MELQFRTSLVSAVITTVTVGVIEKERAKEWNCTENRFANMPAEFVRDIIRGPALPYWLTSTGLRLKEP